MAVYLIWGSTYLAIRVAVETLPPFVSGAMRFVAAGVVLVAVLAVRRGWASLRITRGELAGSVAAGLLLLVGGNGLVVLAETGPVGHAVPSGIAALLVATVPLVIVGLRAATGDRPGWPTVAGVLIGLAGLVVLVRPGSGSGVPLGGALLVVGAAVAWSLGSFVSRWLPLPANAFVATSYQMGVGGLALAGIGAARGEWTQLHPASVSGRSWLAMAYLMVAGSLVAYTAYVWLLQSAPISLVSTYAYVNPAVAVVLGALLVAEPVTVNVVLGGAIIVAGVAVVVSTERSTR